MRSDSSDRSNPGQPPDSPKRQWYLDEIVVAAFAFLGVGGAVFLPLRYGFGSVPPIVVSMLLATGLAALTYRYLGGITPGTSFKIGTLKLGGTLAALVGIAWFINGQMVNQVQVLQVWDVYGTVVKEGKQEPINELVDADFQLSRADVKPESNGDFHLRFILDPNNDVYVRIKHDTYGPVIIPLIPEKLKQYPAVKMTGKRIDMGPIILPEGLPRSYTQANASALKPKDPSQLPGYSPPTQPPGPSSYGGPQ
jgi:hypothetical protein